MYQLFVGEIGIPRHEFLLEMKWWELQSVIRGYHNRHHVGWEQARLVAYFSRFCMGSKNTPPTIQNWLPFTWERNNGEPEDTPTSEEVKRLRQMMMEENARLEDG